MATIRDYLDGVFRDSDMEEVGIGGFTALARTNERTVRTADAPLSYLEDGTQVNDHIILDPVEVVISGQVADVYVRPRPTFEIQRRAQSAVGLITQYLPNRSQAEASRALALADDFNTAVDRADQALDTAARLGQFAGITDQSQSHQQRFIDFIEGAHNSKALIQIEMPYRTYDSMLMTSVETERDNQLNATVFSITARQVRIAETLFVADLIAPSPSEALDGQLDEEVDRGLQEGGEDDQSFLNFLMGGD